MELLIVALIFLLILSLFAGHYRFYHITEKDRDTLFNLSGNTELPVTKEELNALPKIVRAYLIKAKVVGKCRDCHLIMKQRGRIRQKEGGNWLDFTAKQVMTSVPPGFVWAARSFPIFVKDKCINGQGEVRVSFLGLKNMGVQLSREINESALNRCLAELPLYPVGFLSPAIRWEELDGKSVRAKISLGSTQTEGIFFFNDQGLMERFESIRYKGDLLERFTGKLENYEILEGLYVPTKMTAIWNLAEGDFEYFNSEIIDYRID